MKSSFSKTNAREIHCRSGVVRRLLALAGIGLAMLGMTGTLPAQAARFGTTAFLSFRDVSGEFPFARPAARDREIILDLMKEAGLTDLREAILQWGEIEPNRGDDYDFSAVDGLLLEASKRNIDVLGIFTALPLWATRPGSEGPADMGREDPRTFAPLREFEADFRRFVFTAVRRYGSSPDTLPGLQRPVRNWEFYNEVDAGWWQDPDVYAYWLRAFSEEVKRADPGARVVLAGLASTALTVATPPHRHAPDYLERLLATEALKGPGFPYFDVVNLHNYPVVYGSRVISGEVRREFMNRNGGREPRGVLTGYEPFLYSLDAMKAYVERVMDAHQLRFPVWLTEVGDNSQFSGPEEQAARIVKYLTHAASLGFERVFQFCFYDLGTEPGQGEWGLVKLVAPGGNPPPKPAFDAVRTFTRHYRNVESVEFLGPGNYRLNYSGGKRAYVLWRDPTTPKVSLPGEIRGRLRVIDRDGAEKRLRPSQLQLTSNPVIVFLP